MVCQDPALPDRLFSARNPFEKGKAFGRRVIPFNVDKISGRPSTVRNEDRLLVILEPSNDSGGFSL